MVLISAVTVKAENQKTTENIYKRLSALQCDSLIKANEINPNFVILDVRTPGEWTSYHIYGSINRSTGLTDFAAQLDALPKQKKFLLHCQSGGRSAGAFAKMKELGFSEVYEMIGGLNAWNSAKLPTTTVIEPKLMLVSYSGITSGNNTDTVKVTITNRANGKLTFSNFSVSDVHPVNYIFNSAISLGGSEDYTFSVIHSPAYYGDDSTSVKLESNGGNIDVNIVLKNGSILKTNENRISELAVYPNPANSYLYFRGSGIDYFDEVSVINIAGQKIFNEFGFLVSKGIDVSNLNNGIYIIRIKSGGYYSSQKFIVKH